MSDVILRVSNVRRSHLLASPKRCRFADVRGKSEILSGQVSRRSCATAEDEEARSLLVQDPEVEECVISFDLSAASVLVLTAPSGFGKSTLLKALAGLVPIDGGVGSSVLLRDESCSGLVPAVRGGLSEWRSRVRYVPAGGGAALFKESTPRKTLELIARYKNQNTHHPSRFRFWNVFQGTPASRACLDSSTLKAASHLEALGLPSEVLDKAWSSLSAGEAQRAILALALSAPKAPRVLLLDEPTSACDPETALKAEDLFFRFCIKHGCGAIIVSHDQGGQVARLVSRGAEHIDLAGAVAGASV